MNAGREVGDTPMTSIEQACQPGKIRAERERPGRCANTVIPGLTVHLAPPDRTGRRRQQMAVPDRICAPLVHAHSSTLVSEGVS